LSKRQNLTQKSFDIVVKNGNTVAKIAKMSKHHSTLSNRQYFTINSFDAVADFWQQSQMLLQQSQTLL